MGDNWGSHEVVGIPVISMLRLDIKCFKEDIAESKHRIQQEIKNVRRCTRMVVKLEKQLEKELKKMKKK